MMNHSIDLDDFIDFASDATVVEYGWEEADDEEPRLDGRDGCWQVSLRCGGNDRWIGDTINEADAVAFAEKVARFLKIEVRKAQQ